ncbi:MAG: flagellar biosynthesis anti-sigma factor FlgM [Pelovirga sp.]
MVDRIVGNRGYGPVGQMGRTDKAANVKKNDGGKQTDRVDFSSALKDAEKTGAATSAQETARMDKIAALKSQIQDGTYKPDLNKVAASLLPFLMRES